MTANEGASTILLVDDRRSVRSFWKRELERDGYRVVLAEEAGAALRTVQEEPPDLVIIDVQMRGIQDSGVAEWMLAQSRRIPVVIYTAARSQPEALSHWCADACIDKADDIEVLRSTIVRLLEGRKETQGRSLRGGEKEEKG